MKKLIPLVFVSVLGGVLTLGSYILFFKQEQKVQMIKEVNKDQNFGFQNTTNSLVNYLPASAVDFTNSAQKTVDAVVHVKNTSIETVRDPFEELIYGRGAARTYHNVGTGSGVIVSSKGHIITNYHVIKNATELEITLNNKKTYKATVIGTDAKSDIALLKINATDLAHLKFGDSDQLKVGEWVLAVGNPFNLTSTVTAGIVSAKARDIDGNEKSESFIQTDAAVNPGNSGGALVNVNGELIGINTAITTRTGSFVGYSFAVPSNIAKKVMQDIIEYGFVQRAILGVRGGELNNTIANELNLDITQGYFVSEVVDESGAFWAGIKPEDIITKIDHVKIKKFSDLDGYLKSKKPGDTVNVTVIRNNKINNFDVVLIIDNDKKDNLEIDLGFALRNLTTKELKSKKLTNGILITGIESDKLVEIGLKNGFIITKVNNIKVKTAEQVKQIISKNINKATIRIEMINLSGTKEYFTFK